MKSRLVVLGIVLCSAFTANAKLWMSDSVPIGAGSTGYNGLATLSGKEPAIEGQTGKWLNATGVFQWRATEVLNYDSVPSTLMATGGTYVAQHTDSGTRYQPRQITLPANTNVYFSALMAYQDDMVFDKMSAGNWTGVGLSFLVYNDNNSAYKPYNGGILFSFRKMADVDGQRRVSVVASAVARGASSVNNTPQDVILKEYTRPRELSGGVPGDIYMVLAKVEYNPNGPETISFALNPVPGQEDNFDPANTISVDILGADEQFQYIKFGGNYSFSNKAVYYDEFRIGSTYADVVGEPRDASMFMGNAHMALVDGGLLVTTELASHKTASPVYLLMGTEPDVWSVTNTFSNVAPLVPLTLSPTGIAADTTYYYNVAVVDAPDAIIYSGASPVSFLNGDVWLSCAHPFAYEEGVVPATVTVHRASANVDVPLSVNYSVVNGTAVAGEDFVHNHTTGRLVIPAGAASADIVITPIINGMKHVDTTLGVQINPGPYFPGAITNIPLTIVTQPIPEGYNVWLGSGNADVAANWSANRVPDANDRVLLGAYSTAAMNIPAGAPMTVASWTQESGYTGTVNINGPFNSATPHLTILGDALLSGGTWSYERANNNEPEPTRLFVEVKGDLTLAGNATISAYAKGFVSRKGPGYTTDLDGAAHAGEGGQQIAASVYGSIFKPRRYGSTSSANSAGGSIELIVGGTFTCLNTHANDAIRADGNSQGSGGSILVTAGKLTGNRAINASSAGSDSGLGASGGRVAIYLTQPGSTPADYTGTISVLGGSGRADLNRPAAAGGSIYWETADQAPGAGTVLVKFQHQVSHGASFERRAMLAPPALDCDDDYRHSNWVIAEGGKLRLRDNLRINSLTITSSSDARIFPELRLNGKTLFTREFTIDGVKIPAGSHPASVLGEYVTDTSDALGRIVIISPGTFLMLK